MRQPREVEKKGWQNEEEIQNIFLAQPVPLGRLTLVSMLGLEPSPKGVGCVPAVEHCDNTLKV